MGIFKVCNDLTGQVFGQLTVLARAENAEDGHSRWLCQCSCGNQKVVQSNNLKKTTRSCGCLIVERVSKLNLTHGKTHTKEFKTWDSMKQRCENPKNISYKDYGGRGIKVCDRWIDSFENFLADMGEAPSKNHSIDRKDVNGNYEPNNCRWATAKEQRTNQRPRLYKTKTI
ncbi:MAG: hypothetical protein WCG90_08350 [Chitinophagia bacterium]